MLCTRDQSHTERRLMMSLVAKLSLIETDEAQTHPHSAEGKENIRKTQSTEDSWILGAYKKS